MRHVFAFLLCVLLVPFVGCSGGDKPDPDFVPDPNLAGVDTSTDPGAAVLPNAPGPEGPSEAAGEQE